MAEKLVNNWKAAEELESFKQKYLDPLNKKVEEARAIMDDPEQKWKGDQKLRAKAKYQALDTQNIDFHRLYNAIMELILQHEKQTDLLATIYQDWYNKISQKGIQPAEMMAMQAAVLQKIFEKIYDIIEPLKLELPKP